MNHKRIEQIGKPLQPLPEEGQRWTSPVNTVEAVRAPMLQRERVPQGYRKVR